MSTDDQLVIVLHWERLQYIAETWLDIPTSDAVLTLRSPEILAPAKIPVAAGKKMANTEKKFSPSVNLGPKFSTKIVPVNEIVTSIKENHLSVILFFAINLDLLHTKMNQYYSLSLYTLVKFLQHLNKDQCIFYVNSTHLDIPQFPAQSFHHWEE